MFFSPGPCKANCFSSWFVTHRNLLRIDSATAFTNLPPTPLRIAPGCTYYRKPLLLIQSGLFPRSKSKPNVWFRESAEHLSTVLLDTDVARERRTVSFKSSRAFGEIRPKIYSPRSQISGVRYSVRFTYTDTLQLLYDIFPYLPFPSGGGELHGALPRPLLLSHGQSSFPAHSAVQTSSVWEECSEGGEGASQPCPWTLPLCLPPAPLRSPHPVTAAHAEEDASPGLSSRVSCAA